MLAANTVAYKVILMLAGLLDPVGSSSISSVSILMPAPLRPLANLFTCRTGFQALGTTTEAKRIMLKAWKTSRAIVTMH
jgi:hypothetical protein